MNQPIEKILTDYYVSIEKKVQYSTVVSYTNRLKKMYDVLDLDYGDPSIFTDKLTELNECVVSMYENTSTRKTTYACLVILAKALNVGEDEVKKLQKLMTDGIKKYNSELKENIEHGENLPDIKYDEIKKSLLEQVEKINLKKKRLSTKDKSAIRKYIVYNLYTLQPPVRSDYGGMKMLNETEKESSDFNYCDISNKIFIFNNYKTKGKYGRVAVSIRDEMCEIITMYQSYIGDSSHFFTMKKGKPYTDSYFGSLIKDTFGCGCSTLRKIYLTRKYQAIFDLLKNLDVDAREMLHSVSVQRSHYLHRLRDEIDIKKKN